jgi:hypothetical protein
MTAITKRGYLKKNGTTNRKNIWKIPTWLPKIRGKNAVTINTGNLYLDEKYLGKRIAIKVVIEIIE